jgi:hypothetical protein
MTGRFTGTVYWRPKGELAVAVKMKPLARVIIQQVLDKISYQVGKYGMYTGRWVTERGILKVIAQKGFFPGDPPKIIAELIPFMELGETQEPEEEEIPQLFFYFDMVTNERWTLNHYEEEGWVREVPLPICQLPPYEDANGTEYDYGDCPYWVGNEVGDIVLTPMVHLTEEGLYDYENGTPYLYGLGGAKLDVFAQGYGQHVYSLGTYKCLVDGAGWVFDSEDSEWDNVGASGTFGTFHWNQSGTEAMIPGNSYRLVAFAVGSITSNAVLSAGPIVNIPYPSTYTIDVPAAGTESIDTDDNYPPWCIPNPFPACEAILDDPILCWAAGSVKTSTPGADASQSSRYGEYSLTTAAGFFRDDVFFDSLSNTRQEVVNWERGSDGTSTTSDYFIDWGYPVSHTGCTYFATVLGGHKDETIQGSYCEQVSVYTHRYEGENDWITTTLAAEQQTREVRRDISDGYSTSTVGPGSLTQTLTAREWQTSTVTKTSSLNYPGAEYPVDIVTEAGWMLTEQGAAANVSASDSQETELEGVWVLGCSNPGSYLAFPPAPDLSNTYRVYIEGDLVLTIENVVYCERKALAHNSDLSCIFILEIYATWESDAEYRFYGVYEKDCTELSTLIGPSLNSADSECLISGLLPLRARNSPYYSEPIY